MEYNYQHFDLRNNHSQMTSFRSYDLLVQNCNSMSVRIPTSVTLDSSHLLTFLQMKDKCDHNVTTFVDEDH